MKEEANAVHVQWGLSSTASKVAHIKTNINARTEYLIIIIKLRGSTQWTNSYSASSSNAERRRYIFSTYILFGINPLTESSTSLKMLTLSFIFTYQKLEIITLTSQSLTKEIMCSWSILQGRLLESFQPVSQGSSLSWGTTVVSHPNCNSEKQFTLSNSTIRQNWQK